MDKSVYCDKNECWCGDCTFEEDQPETKQPETKQPETKEDTCDITPSYTCCQHYGRCICKL